MAIGSMITGDRLRCRKRVEVDGLRDLSSFSSGI